MPYFKRDIAAAIEHFQRNDDILAKIVERVGPFKLKADRDYFGQLVRSIVSQQISTAAARTILGRLSDHVAPHGLSATALAALSVDQLRSLGVSPQKAGYVHDLADKVATGKLRLDTISQCTDEEVIEQLIQVKGIGVWTAHMFLIFGLARLDVLPVGDLGIKNAVRRWYGFAELPTPAEVQVIAEPWRPYATIASWYLWRSLELPND